MSNSIPLLCLYVNYETRASRQLSQFRLKMGGGGRCQATSRDSRKSMCSTKKQLQRVTPCKITTCSFCTERQIKQTRYYVLITQRSPKHASNYEFQHNLLSQIRIAKVLPIVKSGSFCLSFESLTVWSDTQYVKGFFSTLDRNRLLFHLLPVFMLS